MNILSEVLMNDYKIIHDDLNPGSSLQFDGGLTVYGNLINWHNGQVSTMGDLQLFAHGSFLSYERALQIQKENIEIRNVDLKGVSDAQKWFRDSLLPLTIDAGGDCLCVDENDGRLYQFIHDDEIHFSGYDSILSLIEAHVDVYKSKLVRINGLSVVFPDGLIKE